MGSVAYSLTMFAIVSVLAGVLVAGLFVPYAGLAGMGSKAAADELNSLPTELATPTPPTRSTVYMANGKVLAYFYDENRIPVALNKIAPVMRQAQLAIEDHRYYEHGALDIKGTLRALVRNSTSDVGTQGGSSITQQYVKMVQIEACQTKGSTDAKIKKCVDDARAPTMERKVRELRYAIALEKRLTKDQILSNYLNIAYYGDGAYGVEAAAKHYYNTSASKLNLGQAAMLAGLVQNPDANNPMNNRAAALDRRDVVLNRMGELGLATPAEIKKAKTQGFDTKAVKSIVQGCVGTRYPFLCDYVRRTLEQAPSLGDNVRERNNLLDRGGLKIYTAIDPKSQDLAQKKVSAVVGATDPIISTMNMIQPGTGLIVASAQSRPVMGSNKKKGQTYFNMSAPSEMGGIQGYQAGSTFKPFTMAAAFEKGIPITKKYNAKSPYDFTGKTFSTCDGTGKIVKKYAPKNSVPGHSKKIRMTEAAEYSVNTYFIQLELDAGMCGVTKMAQKLGVKVGHPLGAKPVDIVKQYQDIPSFTLGVAEVAPLSMAEAYATFASGGIHCSPIIVSKIVNPKGKQLEVPSANCRRVIDEDVANGVNKVLKSVIDKGTGKPARVPGSFDQAGKTGTINSNNAVWFAGYTPEIAGVSMISIDNTRKPWIKGKSGFRSKGVEYYTVPSTKTYLQGSGGGDAGAKIWKPVMTSYLKGVDHPDFKEPPSKIKVGKKVTVPYVGNLSIASATKKLKKEGFDVSTQYVYSSRPKYTFLGWSPGAGSRIAQFSTVYKLVSKGKDPAIEKAKKAAKKKADKKKDDKKKDDKKDGG
ncbi:Membrane carboxypeptidase (penicillin-binding protein) [Microlunatus flavus]|uniref:Membrane carboxypeptidase (Penicillin-binding protein) n=1 Tax=Microlunatus flavus TaxID=1036181 RepID=A0A1H8ZPN1_9ACTN|nr:Membrane carboxypeptidase (penicillin-binding protein) [Microlunatus flavus]